MTSKIKIAGFRVIFGPSTIGRVYKEAVNICNERGVSLELKYSQPPAAGMPMPHSEWLDYARNEADIIFYSLPQGFAPLEAIFKNLFEESGKLVIPVTPAASGLPPDVLERALNYHVYGGKENMAQFFLWLSELTGKIMEKKSLPPRDLPFAGIYHPKSETYFTDTDSYLSWYGKSTPMIGLLFPRTFWIEENLASYNAIIEEVEKRGAGVIPVFSDGWFGRVKNDDVIQSFFRKKGQTIIDALLVYSAFFLKSRQQQAAINHESSADALTDLNVPILKMIHAARQTEEEWREDPMGLNLPQVIISITLPEFDGLIEPVLVGGSEGKEELSPAKPFLKQVSYVIDRIMRWVKLRKKPNHEKKVAFVLLNSPCKSVEATVGAAFGLDSLESLVRIMKKMQDEGYRLDWVPETGEKLIEEIMGRKALPDFRWTTIEEIVSKGGAADFVDMETYRKWFSHMPEDAQEKVCAAWGNPDEARELTGVQKLSFGLHQNKIVISGINSGNVFVGVQPKRGCAGSRCDGEVCKILHDPDIPPPHQWLAWHKWLEEVFEADVIVHVGTHGVLELLPGKTTALTESCFSRISLGNVPHLYIYNLTNPMEAVVAKRRSNAVITDHMPPVLATMRLTDDLADLEELLEDYEKAFQLNEKARAKTLLSQLEEKAKLAKLLPEDKVVEPAVLHEKLSMLRESQFRDGLHIFGEAPVEDALAELVNTVLRIRQPDCPAFREALCECFEKDYAHLISSPEEVCHGRGTNGKMLDNLDRLGKDMLLSMIHFSEEDVNEALICIKPHLVSFSEIHGLPLNDINDSFKMVVEKALRIFHLIRRTDNEMQNLFKGFNGEFIEPGASGALARGKVEVLPTGRNMYAVDPWRIPTNAAWEVGKRLADDLISRYSEEQGELPETIGFTLRAMDPYRSDGEMIAQILYTLGVEPVWSGGRVVTLKPIPLKLLGRPRIDATINLSSMLRDGMPRAFELIDQAVQLVTDLDEPDDQNFIRKHVLGREKELSHVDDEKEKRRLATFRIFSAAPGTYGTHVETAVASSAWKEEKDLANVYFEHAGYAYGEGVYARKSPEELMHNCSRVTVTFEKFDSDEIDLLDCCHIYGWHGGFTNAAEVASNREVKTLYGDTSDPDRPVIRTLNEELSRIAHARLLNPAWIEGKKRHGYKGAGDISSRTNHMYGWQATTRQVDNWVFDGIFEKFVADEENRKFFEANNPWALEEIARRLLEAESRGLWKADPEMMDQLKEIYLEIEAWLEDRMGDVEGDFQGGAVDVMNADDIPELKGKMAAIEETLSKIKKSDESY